MMKENEDKDNALQIASVYYYLYRQAECPFGDHPAGLHAWVKTSIHHPFKEFCKRHEKNKNEQRT